MDDLIAIAVLVAGFFGLVVPGLAIRAIVVAGRQRERLDRLESRIASMEASLVGLASGPARAAEAPAAPATPRPADATPPAPVPDSEPLVGAPPPIVEAETGAATEAVTTASAAEPRPSTLDNLERSITSRWFVWLGAATLALAGVFLVREAVERGWLGPGVRVSLGFLAGLALIALGEWVRRRFPAHDVASRPDSMRTDYVPPALSSAGFLFCYASLYAAGQLYGFLPPVVTFAGMAAVSVAASLLAVLHGPFLALLSVIGGFLTPALVATDQPNGWALFGYLFALVIGGLAMSWFRGWIWMSWLALAGSLVWALTWTGLPRDVAAPTPLAMFVVALAAVHVAALPRIGPDLPAEAQKQSRYLALAAGVATALLAFGVVRIDGYGALGLGTLAAIGAVLVAGARRHPALDRLAPAAAAVTVAALALWHLPAMLGPQSPVTWPAGAPWGPHVPPEAATFLTAAAAFGAAYAVAGFAALWGAGRPILWACVSMATPILLLVAAYWRVARFEIDLYWSTAALAVGLVALAMTGRLVRYREQPDYAGALAIYAAAVTGAVTLALTMALRDGWLSVALSLELPALAWIQRRLPVKALRVLAGLVATLLLARLAFNPDILSYARASAAGEHWPLYGYGVPLAAAYWAWRGFARERPDWLDAMLRALVFGFAALLVAFEYRAVLLQASGWRANTLLEQACFPIGWLALASGLTTALEHGQARIVAARRVLLLLAAAHLILIELAFYNPVWTRVETGAAPVLNVLLLAYAIPAGLLLAFAWITRPIERRSIPFAAAAFALLLGFAWVSLETRHAFQGSNLADGDVSEAESYAYSVVWLAYAGVLLAGGLWQKSQALRFGSLIVVMAAVLKVFIVDMADLAGLWRVASFFGLGLCLVGIGFLYQRFVFVRTQAA